MKTKKKSGISVLVALISTIMLAAMLGSTCLIKASAAEVKNEADFSLFAATAISPPYLDIEIIGRTRENLIFGPDTWEVKIMNNNDYEVQALFNSYMCFEGDAKNWTGLEHVDYRYLPSKTFQKVFIEGLGFATTITFSYVIGNDRYITYANKLSTDNSKINKQTNKIYAP